MESNTNTLATQNSQLTAEEVLGMAHQQEEGLLQEGFIFCGNSTSRSGEIWELDAAFEGRMRVFGEENVAAIRGVQRWLFGMTGEPQTFTYDDKSMAVYVRTATRTGYSSAA